MSEPESIVVLSSEAAGVEAELARGLREGRPEAYSDLRRRFGRRLSQFAQARLMGDAQLAEDLTVQTFADAVRNIRRFDPRRSTLAAWLYGILRRHVQREWTRSKRRKCIPPWAQVSLDSVSDTPADGDPPAESASRIDAQRQVAELARTLADIEFEVLVLSCVEEFSVPEIGRIVGRSKRAIHSLLHRARRKARERLGQDDR